MKKIKNKRILLIGFILLIAFFLFFINDTKSTILDNDVNVLPNSELIYYLDVKYDGVDKYGVKSNDLIMAKINSDYVFVEDKIPNGLIFNGFVESPDEDKSIGAISRDGENKSCLGFVVDDTDGTETLNSYHGLHYDEKTRKVTFKVKGLEAGCVLTVGIKTLTPEIDDPETSEIEYRRDFYNTAFARENSQSVKSNTLHAWMGDEYDTLYSVTYEYVGDVPDNVPLSPIETKYVSGTNVGVENNVEIEGYEFSGWISDDITIINGTFKMPEKNVKLVGSFKKINSFKVTYKMSVDSDIPEGFVLPTDKEYYPNATVKIGGLKIGDTFNGYKFLGWKSEEVTVSNDLDFIMPNKDVLLECKFELAKYKIEYKFYDTILPPNYEEILPATKEYLPGENISLEKIEDVSGYHFLGWYKENEFIMPEEDIVVYGEWKTRNGLFSPTIEKNIISPKDLYKNGDIVRYEIRVTNNADYPLKNVYISENNLNAYFIQSNGYTLETNNMIVIPQIEPYSFANVYAEYKVTQNDKNFVTNEVEIISASADNYYELNPDKTYKASISFNIYAKLNICNTIDKVTNSTYEYHITSSGYDTWITVEANSCKSIYLKNEEYKIRELVPQDNEVDNEIKTISVSGNGEITFNNKYKKKGFYKSNGEVKNIVEPICDGVFPLTGECAFLDSKASEFVTSSTGIDFSQISSDTNGKGLYIRSGTENDEYPIYYYRGAVTNNNIIYAGFCWKMVRTTETGGIKLIYNGEVGTGNTCNNTDTASQIGTSAFNSTYNNAKYVGYMYDTSTSSTIKTAIDNWYETNILDKYDAFLEDTIWCNDRSVDSILGNNTYYGAYGRLATSKTPSLTCSQQADKYTLKSTSKNYNASLNGNKLLDYPIALLTADEDAFAGGMLGVGNDTYYLYTDQDFWLLSPFTFAGSRAYVAYVNSYGGLHENRVHYSIGVRPAVSLRSGTSVTTARNAGDAGSAENPYIVK